MLPRMAAGTPTLPQALATNLPERRLSCAGLRLHGMSPASCLAGPIVARLTSARSAIGDATTPMDVIRHSRNLVSLCGGSCDKTAKRRKEPAQASSTCDQSPAAAGNDSAVEGGTSSGHRHLRPVHVCPGNRFRLPFQGRQIWRGQAPVCQGGLIERIRRHRVEPGRICRTCCGCGGSP